MNVNYGGHFIAAAASGCGIYAEATSTVAGTNIGGFFKAGSSTGLGIYSEANGNTARGVYAKANGANGSSQMRGKGTLFEFGIHVPLLVRWPGKLKAASSTAELISGEDLAPTLLAAAGVEAPKDMTGRSFLDLLIGKPYQGRKCVFAERGAHGSGLPNNSAAFDLSRCVVTKTHKLIYNALWQIPYTPVDCANDPFWKELKQMNAEGKLSPLHSRLLFSPARPMFELFDLVADPNEFNNLVGNKDAAAIESELKALLQEWMILERDYLPLPVPPAP